MDGPQSSYGDSSGSRSVSGRSGRGGAGGSGGGGGRGSNDISRRDEKSDGAVATEMSTVSQSFLYYQQQQQQHSTTDFQQQQPLATKATIQEHHPSTTYPRHQVQLPPQLQQQQESEKKHIRYQPIQYQIEYEKQQFQQQNSHSHRVNAKRIESNKFRQNVSSIAGGAAEDEVSVSLISSPPLPMVTPMNHPTTGVHPKIQSRNQTALIEEGGSLVVVREATQATGETGDGANEEEEDDGEPDGRDVAGNEVAISQSMKRSRSKHRPLFRRLFHYVRNTLIGQANKKDQDECEVYELPPRYRPESVTSLCRVTRFSEEEVKRLYRGFKAECPSGVVREDTFKIIYSQFFSARANTGNYAHFVFNTLDQDNSGIINFEDFLQTLSILSRGTMEEKLTWTFALYDINGDGCVTREEMTDIVTAIYDMVDRPGIAEPTTPVPGGLSLAARIDGDRIKEKVDQIFQKMDTNQDGVVTLDEFISCCRNDEVITNSMIVFDNIVL